MMDGLVFSGQSARACPGEHHCAVLNSVVVNKSG